LAGRFITFEGGDGTGKTTQVRRLGAFLGARGLDVLLTREPGGSPGGEEIRGLLVDGAAGRWDALTETLLHLAARREHVVRTVQPALDAGRWVISDRFADSTVAYQGRAQDVGVDRVRALNAAVLGPLRPDLTLILDLAPEQALSRMRARGAPLDRYDNMDADFHRRLRDAFTDIAASEPDRCVLIDAAAPEDEVAARIGGVVTAHFGLPDGPAA
jgi:dTMP kinase